MSTNKTKILFFNQMAGPLFRVLAEDLAGKWTPSILYTGHPDTLKHGSTEHLTIKDGPSYDKRSEYSRVWSWLKYFCCTFFVALKSPPTALLFFTSNPPFLPLIGYLLKKLRHQSYVVLIYDIHPDLLIRLGRLKGTGFIARLWRRMNSIVYENAEIVFTVGDYMAATLEQKFDAVKTKAGKVIVIPPWVDRSFIQPIRKSENWFAKKYNQLDKLTVLYSGNLGATHNIELIIEMARELECNNSIHFLIIGEGAKYHLVEKAIEIEKLDNITLLPFQPEAVLPFSMATGDIAIVSMQPGTEGLMMPSKAFHYMAAGCHLLFFGDKKSEIGDLCKDSALEKVVTIVDETNLSSIIESLKNDSSRFTSTEKNTSLLALDQFARKTSLGVVTRWIQRVLSD